MTARDFRKIKGIIKQLDKIAARAGELDLQLGNGGDVSSLLGEMSNDLYWQLLRKEEKQ